MCAESVADHMNFKLINTTFVRDVQGVEPVSEATFKSSIQG